MLLWEINKSKTNKIQISLLQSCDPFRKRVYSKNNQADYREIGALRNLVIGTNSALLRIAARKNFATCGVV